MTPNDIQRAMRAQGRADALNLASRAPQMDGTAIIAEESKVPLFVWGTDYSGCPVGAPIGQIIDGELQIFTMLVPVNTALTNARNGLPMIWADCLLHNLPNCLPT